MRYKIQLLILSIILVNFLQITYAAEMKSPSVIYKWISNDVPNYAAIPPFGVSNYTIFNQDFVVAPKQVDEQTPIRPPQTAVEKDSGVIPAQSRCEEAKNEIAKLESKGTAYDEDDEKNLVPLDDTLRALRIGVNKQIVETTCKPNEK